MSLLGSRRELDADFQHTIVLTCTWTTGPHLKWHATLVPETSGNATATFTHGNQRAEPMQAMHRRFAVPRMRPTTNRPPKKCTVHS